MGLDHSRVVTDPLATTNKPSRKVLHSGAEEWSEIHCCTLAEWSSEYSYIFGFDHQIEYCIPQLRHSSDVFLQNIQPYCTRGYQFKIEKLQKVDEQELRKASKGQNKYNVTKYAHKRPRYIYPLFAPTVSIIGYQRRVAVLQVIYKKTKELHFIAIELSTGRHLSVYRDIYLTEPCIYEAYISPDETCYLLRPNFYFAFSRCPDPFTNFAITKDIKLISIQNYESQIMDTIEDTSGLWYSVAFHPLYGHSRIALGNYTANAYGDNVANMCDMKITRISSETCTNMSHHLLYNPQGTLLVSLGIQFAAPRSTEATQPTTDATPGTADATPRTTEFNLNLVLTVNPVKVLFYHPDDLTVLHILSRDNFSVNHFHASLTPLFSKTGSFMALIGNFGQSISVYKMPQDYSLKHRCRLCLLESVEEDKISSLPLPKKLLDYLLFQPLWK